MTNNNPLSTKGIQKLTEEVSLKLGMRAGDWVRNACLWQVYKTRPKAFDRCTSYEEAVSKGLVPQELLLEESIDLNF